MNRFIVDYHPDAIAKALCDQHVVKMPLEEAQMLCTSLWHHAPEYAEENELYKPVHQKHPCTLWAMKTRANYSFARLTYQSMLSEYTHRYGKYHGAGKHAFALFKGLKTDEDYPINAYRAFYKRDKVSFARWNKNRVKPDWFMDA